MGYPSLVENGLLFHHIWCAIHPWETLKGLARSVFLLAVYKAIKERGNYSLSDIEEAFMSKEGFKDLARIPILFEGGEIEKPYEFFKRVFGTKEKRGEIIFFDAFPEKFNPKKHLVVDIMNPHYSEYYTTEGKEPPADWHEPTPIHFLAISGCVSFKVCLGYAPFGKPREDILEIVEKLLKAGLGNFGVGGKKRKGYGWFY